MRTGILQMEEHCCPSSSLPFSLFCAHCRELSRLIKPYGKEILQTPRILKSYLKTETLDSDSCYGKLQHDGQDWILVWVAFDLSSMAPNFKHSGLWNRIQNIKAPAFSEERIWIACLEGQYKTLGADSFRADTVNQKSFSLCCAVFFRKGVTALLHPQNT